jgi:alpha-amylase
VRTSLFSCLALAALAACGSDDRDAALAVSGPVAFVQLFEWDWADVATECETVLGASGYSAVQVSPPNEHIEGPAWWTRYQPVSYRIESRNGTRTEFADMVARCNAAGVDVYADAVINHMAGFPAGTGVAGSSFTEYEYPTVPYDYDDFHHCGRNDEDTIEDYQDLYEIQNCQLGTLDDLDTSNADVQRKIATYLNDLLSLGVGGFRIDAAKHMHVDDVHAILQQVDDDPFVYLEVIDRGGEPIQAAEYLQDGYVTEFKYADLLLDAFERGNLAALTGFWNRPGWIPADKAIVFVDNHDIQRGHATGDEVVNYKDGRLYDLAVAFMLAHPYGYPLVMSSYAFDNDQQGPPDVAPGSPGGCGAAWICEHRRDVQRRMVEFRAATAGAELSNWQIIDDAVIAFGRSELGHIAINASNESRSVRLQTSLAPGRYKSLVSGDPVTIDEDGATDLTLGAMEFVALLTEQ